MGGSLAEAFSQASRLPCHGRVAGLLNARTWIAEDRRGTRCRGQEKGGSVLLYDKIDEIP